MIKRPRKLLLYALVGAILLFIVISKKRYDNNKMLDEQYAIKENDESATSRYFTTQFSILSAPYTKTENNDSIEIVSLVLEYKKYYGKESLVIIKDSLVDIVSYIDPEIKQFDNKEYNLNASCILGILNKNNKTFLSTLYNPLSLTYLKNQKNFLKMILLATNGKAYIYLIPRNLDNASHCDTLLENFVELAGLIKNKPLTNSYFFDE